MKILHTSDWHLGRNLYDKKRYDEFEAFLHWLLLFIDKNGIELLLVSGDVFDTSTPSNKAQEIYYNFLTTLRKTCCRNVVIIGGNHDSPSFLNAPKQLLNSINVQVVGSFSGNIEDEVFVLNNNNQQPEAIICAVPFLREKDVRLVEAGESADDKLANLLNGISLHYQAVYALAHQKRDLLKSDDIPIIGMGHLFTSNSATIEGDGVRELYIGTIAHVDAENIASGFDYMALGHLHLAQTTGVNRKVWYSGSPIPMGFNEAGTNKKVIVVDFNKRSPEISFHEVPVFRHLACIKGDLNQISYEVKKWVTKNVVAWLEIEIDEIISPIKIREFLEELTIDSSVEIVRIKSRQISEQSLSLINESVALETLSDVDVFKHCLDLNQISEELKPELLQLYDEATDMLNLVEAKNAILKGA